MNSKLKKNLIIVFITVLIDMLSLGLVMPLLPFYAGMIPTGFLSDKFGRKRMLLISLFGSSCAPKLGYLIIFRFLTGLFSTSVVTCQAYVSDSVKEEEKSKYLSRIVGSSTAAIFIGPLIGSQLYLVKSWLPFLLSGIVYAIQFIVVLIFLDDSPKFDLTNNRSSLDLLIPKIKSNTILSRISSGRINFSLSNEMHINNEEDDTAMKYRLISLYLIIAASLCDLIGMTSMGSYSAKRLRDDYTNNVVIVSCITSVNMVILTAFQLLIFPYLSKIIYIPHIMNIGYFIELIGWVLVNFKPFPIMLCGMIFHILGYGMTAAGPSVIASRIVSPENQGKVLGSLNTCLSIGHIVGPVAFGGLYVIEHRLPFVVGGCFTGFSIILINIFYFTSRTNKTLSQMKKECYEK